jgi:hypothetical protein
MRPLNDILRDVFVENWRQKLISLVLAIVVWAAFKEAIEPGTLDQIWHGTAVQPSK